MLHVYLLLRLYLLTLVTVAFYLLLSRLPMDALVLHQWSGSTRWSTRQHREQNAEVRMDAAESSRRTALDGVCATK